MNKRSSADGGDVWKAHLLGPTDSGAETSQAFFDGKRKAATQAYHGSGRVHCHSLNYLREPKRAKLEEKIRATEPSEDEAALRGYVLGIGPAPTPLRPRSDPAPTPLRPRSEPAPTRRRGQASFRISGDADSRTGLRSLRLSHLRKCRFTHRATLFCDFLFPCHTRAHFFSRAYSFSCHLSQRASFQFVKTLLDPCLNWEAVLRSVLVWVTMFH